MTQTRSVAGGAPVERGNLLTPAYLWVTRRSGRAALGVAAGLGAIGNLAFPPVGVWPALAISLSGLIWLLDGAKLQPDPGKSAYWRVFAFGYTYFLGALYWIVSAFLVEPDLYAIFIWMPLILLPATLAGILAWILRAAFQLWCPGPARLVIFAVAFMLSEWFRSSLLGIGGLPWDPPGMVWGPGGAISQSAAIWGVYGLSLLTIFALASPAALADARPRGTTASRAAPVLAAAVAFGAIWGWGAHRLATIPKDAAGPLVRLIEAGVSQREKYQPQTAETLVNRFAALTGPDSPSAPSILIWPEGALPYYLFEWPDALDEIAGRLGARKLIIGIARREQAGTEKEKAFNSLAVLGAASDTRGPLALYDKHMLVPFGEFTPFADVLDKIGLRTLQKLAPGGFEAGPRPVTLRTPGVPPFGPLICYEAIFPGLSPSGADRPRWLVNISNDSWFGNLSGPFQHAAQARYRAIEEGLPMARVAAGGLTGMIDAYGRWTARGKPADPAIYGPDPKGWKSSVADAPIPAVAPATPYSSWRDGLFWLMLLGINLGLLVLPRR